MQRILRGIAKRHIMKVAGLRLLPSCLLAAITISSCSLQLPIGTLVPPHPTVTPIPEPPTITANPTFTPINYYYVDGRLGSDTNPGSIDLPWQTIERALESAIAGDMILVRGGEYQTIYGAWTFKHSGNESQPISLGNYPGEQVILKITNPDKHYGAFGCWNAPLDPPDWQTPPASFIRIVGTDVLPQQVSDGILSSKGIVIEGVPGEAAGVEAGGDCDNWEISGVDFINVAFGIFTKKRNFQTTQDGSPNYWYVHDNRVYGYYAESGMQFNGNHNVIERNSIYKVTDELSTPYGCQLLNISGNNNVIRDNALSRLGSKAACVGIMLEWDMADANIIEQNTISDAGRNGDGAIIIAGGDNNIIQNNTIYATSPNWYYIYPNNDGITDWPCNEATGDPEGVPANDPAAQDYQYYYPHNCHSVGNQFYDNTYINQ